MSIDIELHSILKKGKKYWDTIYVCSNTGSKMPQNSGHSSWETRCLNSCDSIHVWRDLETPGGSSVTQVTMSAHRGYDVHFCGVHC